MKEKHHTPTFSPPFYQFVKTVCTPRDAKKLEVEYNQFDNPHDKVKVLGIVTEKPKGHEDSYGNIWKTQKARDKWSD